MKIARFFAVLLGILSAALMIFSIGLCLVSLDARITMPQPPEGAVQCCDALQEAVLAGDYEVMSRLLYGQPDLGVHGKPVEETEAMVWDAFLGSLSFEFQGGCYTTDSGIARNAVVTAMDIPGTTATLDSHAHALLTARVEAAEDMAELYDENNNFREELVAQVLKEALALCLAEDVRLETREITLELICRDGQWWAVPDTVLLELLSGGVA